MQQTGTKGVYIKARIREEGDLRESVQEIKI